MGHYADSSFLGSCFAKTLRVKELVSFDLRQRALATGIGLAVAP
jgi:hypothetical protein